MKKNIKGITLLELLIGITISAFVFVVASSIVVALFRSDTKSKQTETIEQSKNDIRTDLTNSVKWADSISFINGVLSVDGVNYQILDERFSRDGVPLTGNSVIVSEFSVSKNSTEIGSSLPSSGRGLQGEYFNGTNFDTSVAVKVDREIDFNWAGSSPIDGVNSDGFSVRWSGQIESKQDGNHNFYLTHNDGARLWIGDDLLVDSWIDGDRANSGSKFLEADKRYNILVEMYDSSGVSNVKLEWSGGFPTEVVPAQYLYPIANQASIEISMTFVSKTDPDVTDTLEIILSPRIPGSIGSIQTN